MSSYFSNRWLFSLLIGVQCFLGPLESRAALAADLPPWGAFELLGRSIAAGEKQRFSFMPNASFEASYLNMPVFVARGREAGPTLCLTAGIHGDELNGIEVARRIVAGADVAQLRGTLVALPMINAEGIRARQRYLADRRDLNREFPGYAGGSVGSIIASGVIKQVLVHCGAVIDLHTASNERSNTPQIRADFGDAAVRDLARHFGVGIVVYGAGPEGSMRRAATEAGIPTIIYEAGEPLRFQETEIEAGVAGVRNVMAYLGMVDAPQVVVPDNRIFQRSSWVRLPKDQAGFFFPKRALGDSIEKGELLAEVIEPFTDEVYTVYSPVSGEIIGMSLPQPVLSGYALFHVAWNDDAGGG